MGVVLKVKCIFLRSFLVAYSVVRMRMSRKGRNRVEYQNDQTTEVFYEAVVSFCLYGLKRDVDTPQYFRRGDCRLCKDSGATHTRTPVLSQLLVQLKEDCNCQVITFRHSVVVVTTVLIETDFTRRKVQMYLSCITLCLWRIRVPI